jgi:CHAT domain-containing protein/Tfp pilus assembly protein PilF
VSPRVLLFLFAFVASISASSPSRQDEANPIAEIRQLLRDARYGDAEKRARALVDSREARKASAVDIAAALDLLVQSLVEGGKSADPAALSSATRAVELKESALGPSDPDLAVSLANLGLVLRRTGKLDQAREHYERALRIREKALGPDHPEVARTLAAMTALASNSGDFGRARDLGARAVGIAGRLQPPDPLALAISSNNLAIALYELNDYDGAEKHFRQALRSYEAALGADHPEVAKTLSNLANVVGDSGDLLGSRVLYERALSTQERRQGRDHPDVALGLNNLADIYYRLGDYRQAQALFERALAILERAYGPEHTRVAMALGNLAEVRVWQGNYAAAEPLYDRALKIREKAMGPQHPSLVYTLTGFAELRRRTGDRERSRELFERALAIGEKTFGPEHPMVAAALQGLGEVFLDQGELPSAEQRILRALDIRRSVLGDGHPAVAESRAALALVFARRGRRGEAFAAALEAERVAREHLQITSQALSERSAVTYAERRVSGAGIALSLLEEDPAVLPDTIRRVWDAVARSRGAILEEVASRQRLVASATDPELARAAGDLKVARERLAALLARSPADPPSRARVEQAARDRDGAERALAERSLTFRTEQQRTRAGLDEAIAALPSGSALVAFAKFSRSGTEARAGDAYIAFVARSGESDPVVVPLGDAARIESAAGRWRSGIAGEIESGRPTARAERVHRAIGIELRRLIWDPLQPSLQQIRRVFVVADGVLHMVNLAALPRDRAGYLLEDSRLVHYLSTERDLAWRDEEPGTGLLIVDDPDYQRKTREPQAAPGQSRCNDLQSLEFEPLPETRREADRIAALWASAGNVGPVIRMSGAAATEAALKRRASGVRVLHLATHGFFLGAWCDDASGNGAAPLLLAGLALAGANRSRPRASGEEDGILMAEEIATLDLHGVEWAVLSACDTGVGLARGAEGLFGLRRVIQIAGARTVIATLWPVDDRTTRMWMSAVYEQRFVHSRPTDEAVRDATVKLLQARRARGESTHPAYWGPFIAAGR